MAIAISVDSTYVPTGDVIIRVSGLNADDNPVALYINDTLIDSDIRPGYGTSFNYTHSFSTAGIYTVKCRYRSTDSNVITLYAGYNFSIAFDEDTYYTCTGNCTVSSTLTDGNDPVEGATISLTGTGSTLSATTDENGVATFNLTNISQNLNLTATYASSSDTVTVTYLDNTTLMGSLYCLGRKLVTNLEAKGITDIDFSDGLTSLVDEIPNIEPSIGGIVLDTALSCSASSNSVTVGATVTFTGKLSCSFDDETQSDDDMEGYIKTALIEFYNGNTLLGSTSTDSNGEYSYTYTTTAAGTLSVIASYDGTDYYEDCVSSAVSVVVVSPTPDSVALTSDKSILSYADSESATLSATVLDSSSNPVEGATVEFFNGSTSMGTATTNSSGVATKTYASAGAGDLSFTAEVGSLVSETYDVQDCTRYDITEYTTRQDVQWAMPTGDFEISADLMGTASNGSFPQLYLGTALSTQHISIGQMTSNGNNYVGMEFKKDNSRLTLQQFNTKQSTNVYYNVKLTRVGNDYTLYWNNQTLTYTNSTINPTYLFLIYLPHGKCKNIKIKPL